METDLQTIALTSFPVEEVLSALDEWWESEQQDAALPGDTNAAQDIMTPTIEIDSHRAVRALLVLQEIVQFEIPESVIKDGGYDDFAEMREHLVPKVQALFEKKRAKQHG